MPTAWEREQAKREKELRQTRAEAEAIKRNQKIEKKLENLDDILRAGISRTDLQADFERRKTTIPPLDVSTHTPYLMPKYSEFAPPEPTQIARVVPGWQRRLARKVELAEEGHQNALAEWEKDCASHTRSRDAAKIDHERAALRIHESNRRIDELSSDARNGKQYAVEDCVLTTLNAGRYPSGWNLKYTARFLPSRSTLLLECEWPLADAIIPSVTSWRYNKTKQDLQSSPRTAASKSIVYKAALARAALRVVYEAFHADIFEHIEIICFNGIVPHVDPTNGRPTRSLLVSLRAERSEFLDRDFVQLDPVRALKSLRANFSNSPIELIPIPAVIEFDISDPRLIEEQDILSAMKDGMNLIDLTPDAFEHIITNLFKKMGFDAYPTRHSKDGGVDCIAYDKNSVRSGKYSVQAKRWTNTVQVDAVRDLFGAMHHERANTGILITTSKFAPACYKFVEDKPMTLIDGSELLDLFQKHTDLKVRIVFPPKST